MPGGNSTVSDAELVRLTLAGSTAEFEEVVRRYEARVLRFLERLSGNPADARDLTQETFVKAYRALDRYNPNYRLSTWLLTIARHKFIDYTRALRPEPGTIDSLETLDHRDPGSLAAERDDRDEVWQIARAHLTQAQFQALWLRYAEDLDLPEVAAVMRLTRPHVNILLFRARQKLVKVLRPVTRTRPLAVVEDWI